MPERAAERERQEEAANFVVYLKMRVLKPEA
jgi:hypothetical protein